MDNGTPGHGFPRSGEPRRAFCQTCRSSREAGAPLDRVKVDPSSGLVCLLRWVLASWARTARAVALVVAVFLILALAIWLLGIYGAAVAAAVVLVLQAWPGRLRRA